MNAQEKTLAQTIDLTISHIFKISGLHRNKNYQISVISDSSKYKDEEYSLVANEVAERTFHKIRIMKAPK